MEFETLIVLILGVAIMLSASGVLLSRDNLYASIYMSITMLLVATTYAVFDLQPVFILITFIFVGAIGVITVALAATYRFVPTRQVDKLWIIPTIITIAVISIYVYLSTSINTPIQIYNIDKVFAAFPSASNNQLIVVFFVSMMIVLLLSVIKIVRNASDYDNRREAT
ncbi:MAG: hypothetical protein ACE5KE_02640 [Methanosarcinales archaeon]